MDDTNKPPVLEQIRAWYRKLPDKKRYLEFITALLTIPVLLTVLLSNITNLNKKEQATPTPTAATQPTPVLPTTQPTIISIYSNTKDATTSPTLTPTMQCTPGVGPITIVYPAENQTVSTDPVCLDISRQASNYCSVVWTYRINNGSWSNYTANSICMYGLTSGDKTLDLRVKSIVTGDDAVFTRHFTVAGTVSLPSPTPATTSGTTQ